MALYSSNKLPEALSALDKAGGLESNIRSAQSVRLFGDREAAPRDASPRRSGSENVIAPRGQDASAKVMP